jgi:hypothetical protein
MSHSYHRGPEGAVLYDFCWECDDRAGDPLNGLMMLDKDNMARLLARVHAVEFDHTEDSYLTANEAKIGRALYRLLVLLERYPEIGERP